MNSYKDNFCNYNSTYLLLILIRFVELHCGSYTSYCESCQVECDPIAYRSHEIFSTNNLTWKALGKKRDAFSVASRFLPNDPVGKKGCFLPTDAHAVF